METHDDEALLQARLQAAPGLRWEQQLGMTPDGWSLRESRLCLTEGLAYVGNAGKPEAEFVASCRGKETLGDLLLKVAAATGQDVARLAPRFLRVVRGLVERGCLLPVEGEQRPLTASAASMSP